MKLFKKNNTDIKKIISAVWNFWTSKTGAFLLAVSAIVIGWYQFYINRPILKYGTETIAFISSQNQNDYEVKVKGTSYKDLYLTRVILQNKGAEALSGADVSKIGRNPIRIIVPKNAEMAHYALDNTITTPDITAALQKIDNNLIIEFDFLNSGYQIGTSILHQNPNVEFKVEGSALNVNSITKEWSERQIKYWTLWILGGLYLFLVLFYVYNHWLAKKIAKQEENKKLS